MQNSAADFTPKADKLLSSPGQLATAVTDPTTVAAQTIDGAEAVGVEVSPDDAVVHAGQLAVEALDGIVLPEALAQGAKDAKKDIQENAEDGVSVLASFERIVTMGKETEAVPRTISELSGHTEAVSYVMRQMDGILSQYRGNPEDVAHLAGQAGNLRTYAQAYVSGHQVIVGGYKARFDGAQGVNNQFEGSKQEADATVRHHQAEQQAITASPRAAMEGHVLDAVADRGAVDVEEHKYLAQSDQAKSETQIDDTTKAFELTSETLSDTLSMIRTGAEIADSLPTARIINDGVEHVITYIQKLLHEPAYAQILGEAIYDLNRQLADASQKLQELDGREKQFSEATGNIQQALQQLVRAGE